MLQIFKHVFSCKDRRRYSRKRAKFCRKFAKNWQLPYGSTTAARRAPRAARRRPRARGVLRVRPQGPHFPCPEVEEGRRQKELERKIGKCFNFLQNFANFWRARSRLYQNEILQENMRLTAFLKLYNICMLLHFCNLKIFAENRFEKSAIFV